MFTKGERIQHKDHTYACFGTVVGYDQDGEVLVLWDAVDDALDAEAVPEPEDNLERS